MKTRIIFTMAVLLALSVGRMPALADDVQQIIVRTPDSYRNDIEYTIYNNLTNPEESYAEYTACTFLNGSTATEVVDALTYDGTSYPVTSIASRAFYNNDELQYLYLGSNLTTIGEYAFYDCDALESITAKYPEIGYLNLVIGDYAFYSCDQLREVMLPGSHYTIGNSAFRNDKALTIFDGLNSADIIGDYAFANCENLDLGGSNYEGWVDFKTVGSCAFQGCSSLGRMYLWKVTSIDSYAFNSCTAIQSVSLSNDLVSLGARAFGHCSSLQTIKCGSGLQSIGNYAFEYCTALTEVTLPDALISIGSPIFQYCGKQLDCVTFNSPADFTYSTAGLGLESGALILVPGEYLEAYQEHPLFTYHRVVSKDATHTATLTLSEGGTLAQAVADEGLQPGDLLELTLSGPINGTDIDYLHGKLTNITTLDLSDAQIVAGGDSYHRWNININTGEATKSTSYAYNTEDDIVGDYMFQGLPFLKSIRLPRTATDIGTYAVAQCYKLASAELPENVQTIGEDAFYNCWLLAEAELSEGVTSIGRKAFYCCALREVTIPSTLTTLGYYAFGENDNLERVTFAEGCTLSALPGSTFCGDDKLKEVLNLPSTVTSIGAQDFYSCKLLERVTFAGDETRVQTIGAKAFRNCYCLQSFPLSTELATIGEYAFSNCTALTGMQLPAGVTSIGQYAFSYMTALESATLPAGITELPTRLFCGSSALADVTLQGSITSIGSSCFDGCSALTALDANAISEVTTLGDYAFQNTGLTTFPALTKVTSLGRCCFLGCASLKELDLSQYALTTLPERTAENCTALETVWLPEGVQTLDYEAFQGCTALTSIRNTDALRTLGNATFNGCEALTYASFETAPDQLTRIGYEAFRDCKSLTQFPMPATLTTLDASVFRGSGLVSADLSNVALTTLPYYTFYECAALKEVKLYPGLTDIGSYAFYKCTALDTLDIPASVTSIDQYAFAYTALQRVSFSDNVTTLGHNVLAYCDSLRYVNLGRNTNYGINFTYLYGCNNVDTLRIYAGTVPTSVSAGYLSFRSNCVLEVPMGTEELYQAANLWQEFKEIRGFLTGDKLDPVDFAVLHALYDNLDGENWTKTWNLETDDRYPGKWYGVKTEGDHITEISLSKNGLAGTLPGSVFTLPELLKLDLSHNAIEGQLDDILPEDAFESKMTSLYLTNNHLTGDLSPLLERLPYLTDCYLNYNLLTGMSGETPENLTASSANFYTHHQFWDYDAEQFILRPDLLPVENLDVGEPLPLSLNSLQDHWRVSYKTYMDAYKAGYSSPVSDSKTALLITAEDMLLPHPGRENHFKNESIMWFGTPNDGGSRHTQVKPYYIRFIEGDVNTDRLVDVTDLVSLTNYLGKGSVDAESYFNFGAADGEDNDTLDVRDIVINVNRILAAEAAPASALARAYNIKESALPEVTLHMADGRLYLTTETDARLCALQIDLRGVTDPDDILPSKAAQDKNIATARTADGCVRVVIYSNSNVSFAEGTNALLRGLPEGACVIRAIGADSDARRLTVNTNGETTGLTAPTADEEADAKIYDPAGRPLRPADARGVIIVDGQKLYRK